MEDDDVRLGDGSRFDPDGVLIDSVLPEGIRVGWAAFSRGLFAARTYPKGSVLYRASGQLTDFPAGIADAYTLRLVTPDGRPVDGFMNHSCDPNSGWVTLEQHAAGKTYEVRALRDIAVGDEVTSDYALFCYRIGGEPCGCDSASCRGSITGFANLPLPEKVRHLHLCDEAFLRQFLIETVPPVVILESVLPVGIGIDGDVGPSDVGVCLVALRDFESGEVVVSRTSLALPKDVAATYLLKIHGSERYFLVTPEEHFVYYSDYFESFGFESLMSHSCEPNLDIRYISQFAYEMTAVRDIVAGERITCDYELLVKNVTGQPENIAVLTFECACGETSCRGTINV